MGDGDNGESVTSIMPKFAVCFSFVREDLKSKKSAWLVPHVIKQKFGRQVVSWRCSWGSICEAECRYALAKQGQSGPLTGETSRSPVLPAVG